ncbi:MAG: hypothetical protein QXS96_04755 [Candidatus Caldarchaeum sp.]
MVDSRDRNRDREDRKGEERRAEGEEEEEKEEKWYDYGIDDIDYDSSRSSSSSRGSSKGSGDDEMDSRRSRSRSTSSSSNRSRGQNTTNTNTNTTNTTNTTSSRARKVSSRQHASSSSSSFSSSPSSSSPFSGISADDTSSLLEDELNFIRALINTPKKSDKPVQAALIDYLGWEIAVLLRVGMHVSRTLGWDIRALYNKYDAIKASEMIIERFDRLKVLMPYISHVSELTDAAITLMQKYKDTKLLLDSINELFPLRCPNCSALIYLTDKQNFFRLNILLYLKNLEREMSSSYSESDLT